MLNTFPSKPDLNQIHTFNGAKYQWNGVSWIKIDLTPIFRNTDGVTFLQTNLTLNDSTINNYLNKTVFIDNPRGTIISIDDIKQVLHYGTCIYFISRNNNTFSFALGFGNNGDIIHPSGNNNYKTATLIYSERAIDIDRWVVIGIV